MNDSQPDLTKLSFVKLKIPRLIPEFLIESVKERTFDVEGFYEYQEAQVDNPFNHLFVLIDELSIICGYLWAESSALDGSLFINTFSVSKDYWGSGKTIKLAADFLHILKEKLKAPRVYWITTNEKFFKKHGFKRSRNVLMEYVDESDDKVLVYVDKSDKSGK